MNRLNNTLIGRVTLTFRDLARRLFPSDKSEGQGAWVLAWAVFESFVFCAGALAVSLWLAPNDPFGVRASFPWLWMVPALLAMRYGTAIGVTAVVLVVLSWFALPNFLVVSTVNSFEFPKGYFLGGFVLILVCGQFSDVWNARSRRLRAVNAYLDERLQTLTKNHFLLRLSHERLEQDLLAKPLTLRETLSRLRTIANTGAVTGGIRQTLPGAQELVQLLGQSCQLEVAAVHALDDDGNALVQPAASLGAPSPLVVEDALYRYALSQNMLGHVQTSAISQESRDASKYVVCAPLLPSNGKPLGMLVVEKMPFFALNDDTLQLLSVLIGYYADGIHSVTATEQILQRLPQCPPELALDMVRLHRIRLHAGIESSLVALVFQKDDNALDIYEQVKRLKRGVDLSWEIEGDRHRALITLLPLAGSAAVEGYLLRIENALQAQFGTGLLSGHVATHKAQLGYISPADTLLQLVERCAL